MRSEVRTYVRTRSVLLRARRDCGLRTSNFVPDWDDIGRLAYPPFGKSDTVRGTSSRIGKKFYPTERRGIQFPKLEPFKSALRSIYFSRGSHDSIVPLGGAIRNTLYGGNERKRIAWGNLVWLLSPSRIQQDKANRLPIPTQVFKLLNS